METVLALSKLAAPCSGVKMILRYLEVKGYRYAIATTSPKPRVPVCVDTAGLRPWFPEDKIHSGESDFNPPRFKPDPAVYQKAAKSESVSVQNSIAVEDSLSGVGSAANAKIGLIVGYVGATHISSENKDAHALSLLGGGKSKNGRGADVVIENMEDLAVLVEGYLDIAMKGERIGRLNAAVKELVDGLSEESLDGRFWRK